MWIAKTKQFESDELLSDELFVPSKVLLFREKPTLAANGGFYVTQHTGNGWRVAEYGTVVPEDMIPDAIMLKEGDCMEVIILPVITRPEILYENPVYKAIIDYGGEVRDNKIGDVIIGEHGKRFEYCKNCGHPWCETGVHCMDCEEWHFDIDHLITKMKGQF